jgi:hypothetical protein
MYNVWIYVVSHYLQIITHISISVFPRQREVSLNMRKGNVFLCFIQQHAIKGQGEVDV